MRRGGAQGICFTPFPNACTHKQMCIFSWLKFSFRCTFVVLPGRCTLGNLALGCNRSAGRIRGQITALVNVSATVRAGAAALPTFLDHGGHIPLLCPPPSGPHGSVTHMPKQYASDNTRALDFTPVYEDDHVKRKRL